MASGEGNISRYQHLLKSISAFETPPSTRAKHYEWSLFDGNNWLVFKNDLIIECNYCQPGTKGITIDTHLGSLYIDYDAMTVTGPYVNLAVRRLSTTSHGQREDIGWYYRDNSYWCEYGVQGSRDCTSSASSQDLERQFNYNPTGSYQFTVGGTLYIVNFSVMTQTNLSTQKQRKVRRRPKFISAAFMNASPNTFIPSTSRINALPSTTVSVNPPSAVTWQFMADEGIWRDYQKPYSSVDSMDIERQYQSSLYGQIDFTAGSNRYTLILDEMYQINKTYKTRRSVRRIVNDESSSSDLCQVTWQFKDMDGCWKNFVKGTGREKCSVSSQQVEMQYRQNSAGTLRFSSEKFEYLLNFSDMTQTNLITGTTRQIRRV